MKLKAGVLGGVWQSLTEIPRILLERLWLVPCTCQWSWAETMLMDSRERVLCLRSFPVWGTDAPSCLQQTLEKWGAYLVSCFFHLFSKSGYGSSAAKNVETSCLVEE